MFAKSAQKLWGFRALESHMVLLPLDGSGGLGGQVIEDAVDALDLGDDTAGDMVQQLIGNRLDGRGHGVRGIHSADDGAPLVHPLAVLHAHALKVRNRGEVLPDLSRKARFIKFLPQDGIGFPDRLQTVTGDGAGAAHTQAGAGEGLTEHHIVRQAQLLAHYPHFILEQGPHRLHQLKLHVLGQAAGVVMGLDTPLTFQNVRPDGALGQERNAVQLPGFLSENLDKLAADDFPLGLRVGNPRQFVQEPVHSVHINEVRIHLVAEHLDDLLRLSLAQQAVVHMDADKLLADGLNEQRRHHRGVHAAGQRQQHLFVPYLLPNLGDLRVDECLSLLRCVIRSMFSGRLLSPIGIPPLFFFVHIGFTQQI